MCFMYGLHETAPSAETPQRVLFILRTLPCPGRSAFGNGRPRRTRSRSISACKSPVPGPAGSRPGNWGGSPVEEGDAVLLGIALRRFGDSLVILIGAGQKRGGEGGEAMLRGVFGGALQPVRIAVGAAMVDVIRHLPDKFPQSVILLHPDLHADGGGVFQQAVPPGLVFLPGVNVGVIPECHRARCPLPAGDRCSSKSRERSSSAAKQFP